jgi:aminoglycoside phosphotransferase (APT) family kinase protein
MSHRNVASPDPIEVLALLGEFPNATCTPLTGGIDARMWRIDSAGQSYALRVLGPQQESQAIQEIGFGHWARNHGLPVPGVVAAGDWNGCPVALLEWAEGQSIAEVLLTSPSARTDALDLGREFGLVQARMHAIEPPRDPHLAERDWREWTPLDDELIARLDRIEQPAACVIHMDYHPLNVLTHGGTITAVLDWGNTHVGDPRADLARTLAILELAPLPDPEAVEIVKLFEFGWRQGYAQIAGEFEVPPLYLWWAGAAMEKDLAPKVGSRSAPWLNDAYIERVREWTNTAKAAAVAK